MCVCIFSPHHEEKIPCIRQYYEKDNPNSPAFQLRKSNKSNAELTRDARMWLYIDYLKANVSKKYGEVKRILKHYKVGRNTLGRIIANSTTRSSLESLKRTGRPSLLNDTMKTQFRRAQRANRKATPRQLHRALIGTTGGGMYKGNKKDHVCARTAQNYKDKMKYTFKGIKPRPTINLKNAVERILCATHLIEVADQEHTRLKVDEKIFEVPGSRGKLSYHPDSDSEGMNSEDDNERYPEVGHKRHIPSIMVLGGVTKPIIKKDWTEENMGERWKGVSGASSQVFENRKR